MFVTSPFSRFWSAISRFVSVKRLPGKALILLFSMTGVLLPHRASAQTLLIDTGSPTGAAATSMDAAGSKNCSPQPSCGQSFQFWAGQFTLTHAATITSVQVWMGPIFVSGSLTVKIYADGGGIPGTALYAQTYIVPSGSVDGWFPFTFMNPNPSLTAGTYWLAFEPVTFTGSTGGGFSTNMDGGAPQPLAHYAVWNQANFINQFGNGYRAFATNLFSFGMRVLGTNYPDLAFGTLGRATMAGSTFGIPFSDDNITGGLGTPSIFLGAGDIPGGWSLIRGSLFPNSLSTGAWSGASICFQYFDGCSQASGSARSVAFRSFTNTGTGNATFQSNALLHGSISESTGGTGGAIGRVYLFDPTLFSNTLSANGDTAQFLVGGIPVDQDITVLFPPQAVISSVSQTLMTPNQPLSAPLTTSLITLAPGHSITVMFDVTTITPAGSTVDFFSTLAPAANLFTDQNGNPVTQLLGVGPAVSTPVAAANLALAPASATNPVGTTQTLTATATDSNHAPAAGAIVYFTIANGGPNASFAVPAITDANGQATFKYTDAGGVGSDSIQAAIGTLNSNTAQITWTTPGPLDHITISPSTATIPIGGSQAYGAQGFDVFNNSLGSVAAATTFNITPDGSCTGATCTASTAGQHTVTATDNGKTAQATLQVGGAADATPPQITCASPDTLWHATDVGIACTASDTGSGLANSADASFTLFTAVNAGTETSTAQTGTHTVCDVAGNCSTAGPVGSIKVDKKGPAVTLNTPATGSTYLLNQLVNANYSCSEAGSGVTACSGTVANGSALDTSSVGTKSFSVTATDAVGNKTQVTNTYTVGYASAGICDGDLGHQILQPINADGSSVWKQGRTVPAKFRVCNANGISVGTAGVVSSFVLTQILSGTTADVDESVSSTSSDTSFHWDPSAQQWIFNISTTNLSAGQTYVYRIQLNDGSSINFRFGLK
jgi:Bacterial Ig-like domain (group 1)